MRILSITEYDDLRHSGFQWHRVVVNNIEQWFPAQSWVKHNGHGEVFFAASQFLFTEEEDAVLFKLIFL